MTVVRACLGLFAAALALGSCQTEQPGDDAAPALQAFVDSNPDPRVVEVQLVATVGTTSYLPGKATDVLAFRDGLRAGAVATVPGPLLEANQGDRVIVHFENQLAHDVTIHWHGLRLPNDADGTPSSQRPVKTGERFTYEFVAVDEGTFWYHPHMHADHLIEQGLQGAIRIHNAAVAPAVAADRVFVLDDVKVQSSGQLAGESDSLDLMVGRLGNVLLVNGRSRATVRVSAGTRERWRFINSANGRYFRLRLAGITFQVIGWDGGLVPTPYRTEELLVVPGERYDVLVTFDRPNENLALQTVHYDRGHHLPDLGPQDLLFVQVGAGSGMASFDAVKSPNWEPLPTVAVTPHRRFVLKEEEAREPRFFINDQAYPDVTPIHGIQDSVEIWEVQNDTEMDHPFHLHGMFFQVLDINGKPPVHLGWKDTVNIPQKALLRFAVQLGLPGRWMYHCHILEHAERGMMGELIIAPAELITIGDRL